MIGMLNLVKQGVYDKRKQNDTSLHKALDKKLAVYRTNTELDINLKAYAFSGLFIQLLDEAIMLNDTAIMSKDQKVFVTRYFNEATVDVISEDLKAFDLYLANYTGEELNG